VTSTGQIPSDRLLSSLLSSQNSTSGSTHLDDSINFTQFLTLFGERLIELDSEEDLVEAFSSFEGGGTAGHGKVDVDEMKGWLAEYGDKMTDEEVRIARAPLIALPRKTLT
jgi:myosin regulatory light chain 12